jgi:hypothetical protein
MAQDAWAGSKAGLTFITRTEGKNILHVVSDDVLYRFEITPHGVVRLAVEACAATRDYMHTLTANPEGKK